MIDIYCSNCHRTYPERGLPYRCSNCGGIFDNAGVFGYDRSLIASGQPGIWRYRHTFNVPENVKPVYLGEGDTPLVCREVFGREIGFKLEYLNPTGSFKDRGSAVLVGLLQSRGVKSIVEDSSGNAGASLAAYAATVGMQVRIYIPDSISGSKCDQIEAYGAQTVRISGPRSNTTKAVLRVAENGDVYASHAYLPFGLAGYATLAYELFEQLGAVPGAVIAPAGQGNLLLAVGRGFASLLAGGVIRGTPRMVGVQALACAPLYAMSSNRNQGMMKVVEGKTLAEGVRIKHPLRSDALLEMVDNNNGMFLAVEENEILTGRDHLARIGFYVEPTSALVWNALEQALESLPDPIVVILTGSGLKSQEN